MLNSTLVTACIIISHVTIAFFITKDTHHNHFIAKDTDHNYSASKWTSVSLGLISGVAGALLMANSIKVPPDYIVDIRNLAVVVAAMFGGTISSVIAAALMVVYRYSMTGSSLIVLQSAMALAVIAVGSGVIFSRAVEFKIRWAACYLLNISVGATALYLVLHQKPNFLLLISYFVIGTTVISLLVYFLLKFFMNFKERYNNLQKDSTKDFLTGINNVRSFDIEFNKAISLMRRKDEVLSLLAIDIDHFKRVNDSYGHAAGDEVLKQIAKILVDTCRDFDIVSRVGGEEFSVILIDCPSSHAVEVAERIRKAVEEYSFKIDNGASVRITVSIGVGTGGTFCEGQDELITDADKALYEAKRLGRNRVVCSKID